MAILDGARLHRDRLARFLALDLFRDRMSDQERDLLRRCLFGVYRGLEAEGAGREWRAAMARRAAVRAELN